MSSTKLQALSSANVQTPANVQIEHSESRFRQVSRRFSKNKMAVAGLIFCILLFAVGLFAPLLQPYPPDQVTGDFSAPPSSAHWLGTDQIGRDVLSRLISAAQVSLLVGFATVAIYVAFGTVVGLLSAYYGGWIDTLVMRITDMFMAFPFMMVILVVVSVVGPSLFTIIAVLALFSWPSIARLVRGSVLSLKQADHVRAAVSLGLKTPRIIRQHIFPGALAPIIVNATFGVASAILTESGLSFLGMGVQPPTASWGNMLSEAQSISVLSGQPWLWLPAGMAILLTVLAINFVGDGLRDALDPKQ
ncbi:oligopeptide ABC transporter permease [Saccharibacillus endophyticus]|uniref:Peptide ABC transporter permease n=1 Tax=Saccharibacillus endophyticus TaxID=2060666 RepID=A0ABQ1ZIW6_9BACL|nr:oligopeptide ABC transporter permease [Saccharibacillus endophyticus]GGH67861.1 peptide ABC transporter permease [Saccharibacillus endophyticus]